MLDLQPSDYPVSNTSLRKLDDNLAIIEGTKKPRSISHMLRDDEDWQGQKDSNPQQRFWRPTCYHYTMPLYLAVTYQEATRNGGELGI